MSKLVVKPREPGTGWCFSHWGTYGSLPTCGTCGHEAEAYERRCRATPTPLGAIDRRGEDGAQGGAAGPTERDIVVAALRRERIDFRSLTLDRGDLSLIIGDYDAVLLIFRPDGSLMEASTLRSGETPGKAR